MSNVCSRAIIFIDDDVILLFRHVNKNGQIKEYYAIPGGHQEPDETIEDCCIREIKEEYGVEIKIIKYLGQQDDVGRISHMYYAEIISGTPKLGGEELEHNNKDNYYEIQRININDLDKYEILESNKKYIREAYALKGGK